MSDLRKTMQKIDIILWLNINKETTLATHEYWGEQTSVAFVRENVWLVRKHQRVVMKQSQYGEINKGNKKARAADKGSLLPLLHV